MNVTNKVLKGLAVSALLTMSVGCASIGSVGNKMVNNTEKSGVIYGAGGVASDGNAVDICAAINNKDYRCANAEDYVAVVVMSKFGFADGAVGINALVKKDFPNLDKLRYNGRLGDKKQPYVKAKVVPNQLGEILEIASTNGDGKCYWSGMPRAGGTVCPAYNWDYRKDNQAAIVFR